MTKEQIKENIKENINRLQRQIDSGDYQAGYVANCKATIKRYQEQLQADYLN
jgi:hypothetical protein